MATKSRSNNIHWKLLLLQIPQWIVGLITLILGTRLLTNPLLPEATAVSKDIKKFLGYAIACGGWNVMALPVAALLYIFPTPVKPPKHMRRMIITAFLEFICVLLWFGLLVWKLRRYYDINECDIDGCKSFVSTLKYFSLITIAMAVLTALMYHSYDKKRRKEKQAETERTLQESLQQSPGGMRGRGAGVSVIRGEESSGVRSGNYVAGSMHSQASLIQEGEPLEMRPRAPSYLTASSRSHVSSVQEVVPLEMISPNYIIDSTARSQVSAAEPSGLHSPDYIASSQMASPAPVARRSTTRD